VLIRTDGVGGTHKVVEYLTKRALSYSLGFGLTASMVDKLSLIPPNVWDPTKAGGGAVVALGSRVSPLWRRRSCVRGRGPWFTSSGRSM